MEIEKQYIGEERWKESSLEDIVHYWADDTKSKKEVKQILIDNGGCLIGNFSMWRIKN
jgi:hypothetical protein